MQGCRNKTAVAVLCTAQLLWLSTAQVFCQSTPTLRRLKPILDTSSPAPPASSDRSGSSSSAAASSGTTYGDTAAGGNSNHSSKIDRLMSQALQAHAAGDSAQADSLFHKVLKLDSKNTDAYYNLGILAEERGDYQQALQYYNSGLHIDPSDQDLKTAYAAATQKQQQLTQAKQQAAAAAQQLAKQTQQTEQLKLLGAQAASAFHAGNYDLAIKDLQIIAAQRPNDPDVQYALAQAYRQKQNASKGKSQSGLPPAAPAFNRGGYSGDIYSGNGYSSNSGSGYNGSTAGQGQGQIVPFTPDATEPPPDSGGYWARGGNTGGGYYNSGYGTSSAMRRAVTGALIGATAGGLMSSMFYPGRYYGYRRGSAVMSGAMTGALWGGMAGLIFGGIR